MSDLIERVARAIDAAAQPATYRNGDMARAAIREVLAALPRPLAAIFSEVDEDDFRTALGFIAREHGIEP